ncbi:zf-RVT domain-containing protein, partial [Cephalotus follicularis]
FTINEAWRTIIPQSTKAEWSKVVWFPRCIPKHSFCVWLVFNNGHRTLDKLFRWGMVTNNKCGFGYGQVESLDHLFFECPYTARIWNHFLSLCGFRRSCSSWGDEWAWCVQRLKGNSFKIWITKLILAAVVYHCWIERNNRLFNNSFRSFENLVLAIGVDIDGKCMGLFHVVDNQTNRDIFSKLNLPLYLLSLYGSLPMGCQ